MSKETFRRKVLGSYFSLFLLKKLPLAYIAGTKLTKLDDSGSLTMLKFKWINQNPFRSMYFAAMHMAAELATGIMILQYMDTDFKFSMLLVNTSAQFQKKSVGKISFECNSGVDVETFMQELMNSSEGHTVVLPVTARNESNEAVANFEYTWSCKKRSQ